MKFGKHRPSVNVRGGVAAQGLPAAWSVGAVDLAHVAARQDAFCRDLPRGVPPKHANTESAPPLTNPGRRVTSAPVRLGPAGSSRCRGSGPSHPVFVAEPLVPINLKSCGSGHMEREATRLAHCRTTWQKRTRLCVSPPPHGTLPY